MRYLFHFSLAFRTFRNNRLRTGLTVSIIALGLWALIGILTCIEVLKASVNSNFTSMGSNSFQITNRILTKKESRGGLNLSYRRAPDIQYREAVAFKRRFDFPSIVGISTSASSLAIVRFDSKKTNPNVRIMGVDENYLNISDTRLIAGRNFSANELYSGAYVCILGNGIAQKIFGTKLAGYVDTTVSIGDVKYRVIGIAESRGGSMLMNADNTVWVPINNVRAVHQGDRSYVISVLVKDIQLKEIASSEAEGLFRMIRGVPVGAPNDFSVVTNDQLAESLLDVIGYIGWAALVIGMITLLGSVIGLMNIMLVSVAERTREIGISKALGARSSVIRQQFLSESVLISILGGALGILIGILTGNMLGLAFETGFIIPWFWIFVGFTLCGLVGIVSGIYPAFKAAKQDPIEALRYE